MEPRGPGFIELVEITPDAEQAVVKAARISYHQFDNQRTKMEDRGLLRYMYQNKHTSPFEMVVIKFHVCMPLCILTQLLRHRTGSFNVLSHRYTPADKIFDDPDIQPWYSPVKCVEDIRMQSTLNRQSSTTNTELTIVEQEEILATFERMNQRTAENMTDYKHLLKMGVAREIARFYLPCGIYTEAVCQFNLHNLLHFLRLRRDDHAQLEIREYANRLVELITPHVPFIMKLFDEEMETVTFNAEEIRIIKGIEPDNPRKKAEIDAKMHLLGFV